jgi:hypothetical protein
LGDLNDLNEMKTGLREAIEKHGQLSGAEDAIARLEARHQTLTQMGSEDDRELPCKNRWERASS